MRMNSPFFLELDEGAVTPMTILSITALEDCVPICGQRPANSPSPDQCIAIAGATDGSDLTVMTYCIPSLPSAGVRRAGTWTVPGTSAIMNSILSVHFADYVHGKTLFVLRNTDNTFQSRLDIFQQGDSFVSDEATLPFMDEETIQSILLPWETSGEITLRSMKHVLVQPQSYAQKQLNQATVHMQLKATLSIPSTTNPEDGAMEFVSDQTYNLCGSFSLASKSYVNMAKCDVAVWDEIDGKAKHPVFVSQDVLALVPGGNSDGILAGSTSDGQLHFVQLESMGVIAKRYSRPFKASNWALSSGIPAASNNFYAFSGVSSALVQRRQHVAQMGAIVEFAEGQYDFFQQGAQQMLQRVPIKVTMFMTNHPSSPTHWLSQIRLDIPKTGETTAVSYMSQEVSSSMQLKQKCNYQTCNGCVDLNVQRLCYGAQQCTLAKCIGTLTNQNRPLCGIGKTAAALYTTQLSMLHGAYSIVVETVSTLVGFGLANYEETQRIGILRWMDDAFYSTMCSAKDAIASFVSILTSVINFVVQSVTQSPTTYLEMGKSFKHAVLLSFGTT